MKRIGLFTILLSLVILLSTSCESLNNTSKGAMIGAGGGAGLGAAVGALIGKDGKSTAIGAAIGTAVGTTAGAVIGKKMDKAAAEAAAIEGAKVDSFTDANDLKALRVTFEEGILFDFNKSSLKEISKNSLSKFAQVLIKNPTMDIMVFGHTDNVGTLKADQKVSQNRADAVADFLKSKGVPAKQIIEVVGKDFSSPIASNDTEAGRAQNRRVEVFMYASEKMIKDAQAGN